MVEHDEQSLAQYSYLWDGSDNGWALHYSEQVLWQLIFEFQAAGPTKNEILLLKSIVPELHERPLPELLALLRGKATYQPDEYYGNIEANELAKKAWGTGLKLQLHSMMITHYLPVKNNNQALLIEDKQIAQQVTEKMKAAGVTVISIHVD